MQSYSLPSAQYISLTLGASGTEYVAPADGYILLCQELTAGAYIAIIYLDTGKAPYQGNSRPSNNTTLGIIVPIRKGAKWAVEYSSAPTPRDWSAYQFIYAVGSAPQS